MTFSTIIGSGILSKLPPTEQQFLLTHANNILQQSSGTLEDLCRNVANIFQDKNYGWDEAIKENPLAFKKAVAHPVGVYDFLLEKTVSLFDRKTADGKKKITDETKEASLEEKAGLTEDKTETKETKPALEIKEKPKSEKKATVKKKE